MSDSPWSALLPAALVGTDRHTGPFPAWPGEVGATIAQAALAASSSSPSSPSSTLPAQTTPEAVLRASGVLASCHLAGSLGTPSTTPLPAPAAHGLMPELNDARLGALAAWALAQGPQRLVHDVMTALAGAGFCLPPGLLPAALDASRRATALRPAIASVLGMRGLWLAAQRDDWKHAAGAQTAAVDDESAWTDGSLDQRRAFLDAARARDPQAARERLMAALPQLPANERAVLIARLAIGLSPADEPLLDKLRADRAREVRQTALRLLLRLPQAAHPQRAIRRVAALTKLEAKLLRKRWTIDAPEAVPDASSDDWASDNLEAERPKRESLGERAWWLYQIVRQVPLSWWGEHTGMAPAELLAWARKSDWHEALVRGWLDALVNGYAHSLDDAAPDPVAAAWADAFSDDWPAKALGQRENEGVTALLDPAARDARWLRLVDSGSFSSDLVLPQMIAATAPPRRLSPALSNALVACAGQRLADKDVGYAWALRQQLPEIACILDASALPALAALPRRDDETPAVAELNATLAQVATVRRAFDELASAATSAASTSASKP
jgi:hypothetical protein